MQRYNLLDYLYPEDMEWYHKQRKARWEPEEIDLTTDIQQWAEGSNWGPDAVLRDTILTRVFALFSVLDKIVIDQTADIARSLPSDRDEMGCFYIEKCSIEIVHRIVYGEIPKTLITDPAKFNEIANAISCFSSIGAIQALTEEVFKSGTPMQKHVVNMCLEGCFLPMFVPIFFLRTKNLLPGVQNANRLISIDETLHLEFEGHAIRTLYKPSDVEKTSQIAPIVRRFFEAIDAFIEEMIPVEFESLTRAGMKQYGHHVANYIVGLLGMGHIYPGASNPYPFMETLNISTKSLFFENRPTEYKVVHDANAFEFDF